VWRVLIGATMPAIDASSHTLGRALELDPAVALRREPFGALAYHYGNRRLVFLKHPDVVRVVEILSTRPTLADALVECEVDEARWPAFERAIASLINSEIVRDRAR
jgi:mycofactocin biosynthesis protein MftB